ncbi:MAG: hypothetical protein ACM357_00125, partial [Gemmatimonadota bacterium]
MSRLAATVALSTLTAVLAPALSAQARAAGPGETATARVSAEREVLATVDSFLAGLRTKDTALMAR